MAARTHFSADDAPRVGAEIDIDWESAPFDVEQFRMGMDVELEHGLREPVTNVTDDDPVVTGKIALADLNEFPDYYTRLERMEQQAKREHGAAVDAVGRVPRRAIELRLVVEDGCQAPPVAIGERVLVPELAE
jgi:Protein of unknown function (DUF5661)